MLSLNCDKSQKTICSKYIFYSRNCTNLKSPYDSKAGQVYLELSALIRQKSSVYRIIIIGQPRAKSILRIFVGPFGNLVEMGVCVAYSRYFGTFSPSNRP